MVAVNDHELCIHCAGCVGVCPADAITLMENKIVVDKDKCTNCSTCVLMCPVKAMKIQK